MNAAEINRRAAGMLAVNMSTEVDRFKDALSVMIDGMIAHRREVGMSDDEIVTSVRASIIDMIAASSNGVGEAATSPAESYNDEEAASTQLERSRLASGAAEADEEASAGALRIEFPYRSRQTDVEYGVVTEWKIGTVHGYGCQTCEDAVKAAISLARCTGSTGSTHRVERAGCRGETEHGAQVSQ